MLTAALALTLRDQFGLGAFQSMVVMSSVPYLVIPWAIPYWARLLARRHVVRFRVVHSWLFVVAQSVVLLAAVTHTVELMYIGALFLGVGDRKSTRLNSSHVKISYAVFCLKK